MSTSQYERKRIVIGFVWGVILGIPAIFIGWASAGFGHGDYILASFLFPWALLMPDPLVLTAVFAQFPLYGILGGCIRNPHRFVAFCMALILGHVLTGLIFIYIR